MIVAERGERGSVQVDLARTALPDRADASERHRGAGQCAWVAHREQQLVILTAMEGLVESRAGEDGRRGDLGGDARCDAEAVEVEREPVAEIHRSGGMQAGSQETAEGEARLGPAVTFPRSAAPVARPSADPPSLPET